MPINCDIILQWNATSGQLRALGAALWRWCSGAAGDTGICQYLDNQALADLLAGGLPASAPGGRNAGLPYVHLEVRGDPARDRAALLESLRRALPGAAIADVRVDGISWRREEGREGPPSP